MIKLEMRPRDADELRFDPELGFRLETEYRGECIFLVLNDNPTDIAYALEAIAKAMRRKWPGEEPTKIMVVGRD